MSTTGGISRSSICANRTFTAISHKVLHGTCMTVTGGMEFDVVYLRKGMMAIIWRGNSTERPSEVSIQFTSIGASIGTTLLGAVSISEKNNHE